MKLNGLCKNQTLHMEPTKFEELCQAYADAQDNFEAYRLDCHAFAIELVTEMKDYFQVPEKQFTLYRINDQSGFQLVSPALVHAIQLKPDNYWHFGVGLTVCKNPETLPEELILIYIKFRKNKDGSFTLLYANDDDEYIARKDDKPSLYAYFDYLYQSILDSYDSHLNQFLEPKTERRLGFQR